MESHFLGESKLFMIQVCIIVALSCPLFVYQYAIALFHIFGTMHKVVYSLCVSTILKHLFYFFES